ncbi:hypothetical protein AZE42_13290, partial [Rhizopogon vesiculosus]
MTVSTTASMSMPSSNFLFCISRPPNSYSAACLYSARIACGAFLGNVSLVSSLKYAIFCTTPFRIPSAGCVDVYCYNKTGTITTENLVLEGVVGTDEPCKEKLVNVKDKTRPTTAPFSPCRLHPTWRRVTRGGARLLRPEHAQQPPRSHRADFIQQCAAAAGVKSPSSFVTSILSVSITKDSATTTYTSATNDLVENQCVLAMVRYNTAVCPRCLVDCPRVLPRRS